MQAGHIDLALGYSGATLAETKLPGTFTREGIASLTTLHLFINSKARPLASKKSRMEAAALIQEALSRSSHLGYGVRRVNHYLPQGIMPYEYYKREEFPAKPSAQKTLKGKKLRIILRKEYISDELANNIAKGFRQAGAKLEVLRLKASEVYPYIQSRDYDILMAAYMGIIPDPDGFLEPLNPGSPIRLGENGLEKLFSQLAEVRFVPEAPLRLRKYAELLKDFERENFVLPLFQLEYPVLKNAKVQLPSTTYRWGLELYDIFQTEGLAR
jgi:MarR-like DNA-binding transcriptional regulator SgrR of sgrS sRNA